MAADHLPPRFFIAPKLQQPTRLRFLQQVAKGAEAIPAFAEIGLATLDGLLEHRGPDLAGVAALGQQGFKRFGRQLHALGPARVLAFLSAALLLGAAAWRGRRVAAWGLAAGLRALVLADQVVVKDELVAVGDEQVRR